ncbi:MAG TPA: Hsp20/alpha crystallin family protein [Symbiobacteriaceae bacterium]|nr:Hsp20/alpha crystallin family protein [Symbiobacteriaceae bacterium]
MWLSLLDLLRSEGPLQSLERPGIQVEDDGSHLLLIAALPGIDRSSLRLQVGERSVSVSGWGTREERVEGPNFRRSTASARSFLQKVALPVRVVPAGARMAWEGDLLHVRIPKA